MTWEEIKENEKTELITELHWLIKMVTFAHQWKYTNKEDKRLNTKDKFWRYSNSNAVALHFTAADLRHLKSPGPVNMI